MKNSLEGLSNISEQAEERIHELKDKSINIVYTKLWMWLVIEAGPML